MKQMGEAAILEMYFKAMPEIAKNIAEPLTKVDKITMYGDGNSSKLTKDIMTTLTQVLYELILVLSSITKSFKNMHFKI